MIAIYLGVGAALAVLVRILFKHFAADRLAELNTRRRAESLIVSRGELVDGARHMNVALALTDSMFIYENVDVEGFLERSTIHEVEYENELITGQPVREGKVLRLRCFSTTFEFVLPAEVVGDWQMVLPPHRITTA